MPSVLRCRVAGHARRRRRRLDGWRPAVSPLHLAARSIRGPTTTGGSGFSCVPVYVMAGCTTPGTRLPRCCSCSMVRSARVMGIMGWSHTAMAAPLPAHHRADPTRHRKARRRADLAGQRSAGREQMSLDAGTPGASAREGPTFRLVRLAVAVGFEPTEACTSHAFEACSFGRSDTLPPMSLQGAVRAPRTVLAEPGPATTRPGAQSTGGPFPTRRRSARLRAEHPAKER